MRNIRKIGLLNWEIFKWIILLFVYNFYFSTNVHRSRNILFYYEINTMLYWNRDMYTHPGAQLVYNYMYLGWHVWTGTLYMYVYSNFRLSAMLCTCKWTVSRCKGWAVLFSSTNNIPPPRWHLFPVSICP